MKQINEIKIGREATGLTDKEAFVLGCIFSKVKEIDSYTGFGFTSVKRCIADVVQVTIDDLTKKDVTMLHSILRRLIDYGFIGRDEDSASLGNYHRAPKEKYIYYFYTDIKRKKAFIRDCINFALENGSITPNGDMEILNPGVNWEYYKAATPIKRVKRNKKEKVSSDVTTYPVIDIKNCSDAMLLIELKRRGLVNEVVRYEIDLPK